MAKPTKPAKKLKLIGFSREQASAARKAMERSKESTPRIVLDAFFPETITLENLTIQPVTASVIMALQKLDSSLMKTEHVSQFGVADVLRALLVMTQPIDRVRELLGGSLFAGETKTFPMLDAAVEQMADKLSPRVMLGLGEKLNAAISDAFSTAVPYGGKGEGGAESLTPARTQGPGSAG